MSKTNKWLKQVIKENLDDISFMVGIIQLVIRWHIKRLNISKNFNTIFNTQLQKYVLIKTKNIYLIYN